MLIKLNIFLVNDFIQSPGTRRGVVLLIKLLRDQVYRSHGFVVNNNIILITGNDRANLHQIIDMSDFNGRSSEVTVGRRSENCNSSFDVFMNSYRLVF